MNVLAEKGCDTLKGKENDVQRKEDCYIRMWRERKKRKGVLAKGREGKGRGDEEVKNVMGKKRKGVLT